MGPDGHRYPLTTAYIAVMVTIAVLLLIFGGN